MKKQNKQLRQFILLITIATTALLATFGAGCKANSETVKSNQVSLEKTPGERSNTADGLAKNIIGKWEVTAGDKTLAINFTPDQKLETFESGKLIETGTYRVIDEKTIESKGSDEGKSEKVQVKIEGDKMTMIYDDKTTMVFAKK